MALIFADGCEVDAWSVKYDGNSRIAFHSTGGRWGGGSYRTTYTGPYLLKYLPAAYNTLITGISIIWENGTKFYPTTGLLHWLYNTTVQCKLLVMTTGQLRAIGGAGTTLATSSKMIAPGRHYHIETKIYFHDTAGTFEVRVNGEAWIALTGIDTLATAGGCNRVYNYFANDNGSIYAYMDDFYVCDDSGSYNNSFLGDIRIRRLALDADTAQADFTLSSGTVGYTLLTAYDGDTGYVYSTTSGHKSTFGVAALGVTPQAVRAVQVSDYSRKDDANSKQRRNYVISGTATSSSSAVEMTTAYDFYDAVYETDPATSTTWTGTGVDGITVGIEVAN
jgi:hypothetical protein